MFFAPSLVIVSSVCLSFLPFLPLLFSSFSFRSFFSFVSVSLFLFFFSLAIDGLDVTCIHARRSHPLNTKPVNLLGSVYERLGGQFLSV